MELIKIINKGEFDRKVSIELNEIMEKLEEGILLVKNNSINFANKILHRIFKKLNIISRIEDGIKNEVLDYKIFKLYRST